MKRSNTKKGFTLVELIVVIAILAILATVSIVGYVSFLKKAEKSNDISLTTQINTALEANDALGKANTLSEATAVLKEMGVDLSKLSPTSDGFSYIWNSETNRVILLDKNNNVVCPEGATFDKSKSFAIVHEEADISKWEGYSIYLASDFKTADGTLTVNTGVDVGENTNINAITYDNASGTAQDVVISTNGGTLTVKAKAGENAETTDHIKHFGSLDELIGTELGSYSYHEYGKVGFATVVSGKLIVENGGKVLLMQRTQTTAKVENNGGTVEGAVATEEALKIELSGVTCEIKTQEEINALKEEKINQNIGETIVAGNNVARIGRTLFATLEEAVGAAKTNDTIVVLKDIELSKSKQRYYIGNSDQINERSLTLDLNGNKLSFPYASVLNLWIYDSVTVKNGNIETKLSGSAHSIGVWGDVTFDDVNIIQTNTQSSADIVKVFKGGQLTLNSGKIESKGARAVFVPGGGMFTMNGGEITVPGTGVSLDHIKENGAKIPGSFIMNGGEITNTYKKTTSLSQSSACVFGGGSAIINGGTLTSTNGSAFQPKNVGEFEVVINNGTIKGATSAVSVRNGNINIKGGTIVGGSECVLLHSADSKAEISGGDFSVTNTDKTYMLNKIDKVKDNAVISVTGGTFHGYSPAGNAADGAGTNYVADGHTVTSATVGNETVYTVN